MGKYLIRRILASLPVLIGVVIVTFVLARLIPGDPCTAQLGEKATPTICAKFNADKGLDKPVVVQLGIFIRDVLTGDLGTSIRFNRPITQLIAERLPVTIELGLVALLIATVLGISAGIISALRRNSAIDLGTMVGANIGVSMPVFWLGLMLIVVFAVQLRWLPASGMGQLQHLILPAVTLGTFLIGLIIRLTRSSMLDVLGQDYIRTARAKGVSEGTVLVQHALKNALIPVVTVLGLQMGTLLGGAVITETVFAWPGMGMVTVTAIHQRDYPVVQSAVLVSAVLVVLINWFVDVLYHYLDPRIR